MKAYRYTVDIYDSTIDFIHANKHPIVEFWVPERNLCFNYYEDNLNIFDLSEPRSKEYEIVELFDNFVSLLVAYLYMQNKIIDSFNDTTYLVKGNENRRIQ